MSLTATTATTAAPTPQSAQAPGDVRLTRTPEATLQTNVPCAIRIAAPTAFEYGYLSAGTVALAINILHPFLPPAPDGVVQTYDVRLLTRDALPTDARPDTRIVCGKGICSKRAFELKDAFVEAFLFNLRIMVGETVTLKAADIAAWIDQQEGGRYA